MINNPIPLHPGKVLAEVYMTEMGLNQTALAERCGCAPRKINEIVNAKRSISPSFAISLEAARKSPNTGHDSVRCAPGLGRYV